VSASNLSAPNLLQIVPSLAGGGLARATLDAAQAVIAQGGSAVVASPGGAMVADLLRLRGTHLELPPFGNPLWARLTLPRRLASSLQTADIDVVMSRSPATAWLAKAVARRLDARWIAMLHRPPVATGMIDRMVERRLARADGLIAVSEHVARSVRERLPAVATDRLDIIPPGVNFDRFDPALVRADRVIRLAGELRLPDGRQVILCPARLDEDRGQKGLIDAVRLLGRDDVFCLLLGSTGTPTAFEREVERHIERATLLGKVQIGPYVDDMPAAYMLADVVVTLGGPSQGFSRALIEAQAMGRPVVTEEGGGAAEAVLAGTTGWLARPDDPQSLADSLAAALSLSVTQRAELARAAQEQVHRRYDLAHSNQRLLALLHRVSG
jgi:glycosyltransferase involved in cell wall biosynthesis